MSPDVRLFHLAPSPHLITRCTCKHPFNSRPHLSARLYNIITLFRADASFADDHAILVLCSPLCCCLSSKSTTLKQHLRICPAFIAPFARKSFNQYSGALWIINGNLSSQQHRQTQTAPSWMLQCMLGYKCLMQRGENHAAS